MERSNSTSGFVLGGTSTISDGINTSTVTFSTWDASYQPGGANYNPDRFDLEFPVADYSGVDKTAITSIALSVQTDVAGDYALYGISTDAIPEPATMGNIVFVAGGVYFTRRIFTS